MDDVIKLMQIQQSSLQKQVDSYEKRLEFLNNSSLNDFTPKEPMMDFETNIDYVQTIKDLKMATLEYDIATTKMNIIGIDEAIKKNEERANN